MYDAAAHASEMSFVHKQHVNRLLEPFTWQMKVITATEWSNFFNLRIAPGAQPEIFELAKLIRDAIDGAEPVDRSDGSWHLPFVLDEERVDLSEADTLRVSAARCARISYARHGTDSIDVGKDLELADMLYEEKHHSPFEHQARKLGCTEYSHIDKYFGYWSGNFRGWLQHRKVIE
jgi:thymidylate synthase ThyX